MTLTQIMFVLMIASGFFLVIKFITNKLTEAQTNTVTIIITIFFVFCVAGWLFSFSFFDENSSQTVEATEPTLVCSCPSEDEIRNENYYNPNCDSDYNSDFCAPTEETNNWCDLGYYYIGAELRGQDEWCASFIDEKGDIWIWEKQDGEVFYEDQLYLLCCHNEGTPNDPYDDTLMVIWTEVRLPYQPVG